MRVKLRTLPTTTKPRVDRAGNGRINGLSLITKGEALGHGFWVDDTTLEQVQALGANAKGRWTHGNLCADGLGTHLGKWEGLRRDGESVVGDFVFSAAAKHVKPEGLAVDAPTYLMDLAEREPDAAGVSTVLELDKFALEEITTEQRKAGIEPKKFARAKAVPRADFVSDPATNPEGLFGGTSSDLSERATRALDEAFDEAAQTYGEDRVRGFLATYLNGRAATASLSAKGGTPVTITPEVQALLDKKDAEVAALRGRIDAHDAAEKVRREREVSDFIASLKTNALPNAIPEAELGRVKAMFDAGRDDDARFVGGLLLKGAATKEGVVVPLASKSAERAGLEIADAMNAADTAAKKK